ncbi:MAG: hypothetical protein ACR2P4_01475 [Gammaproteobacteria bacterium]
MSIGWCFPSSNGGVYDGFIDAGIETYTGARYNGLAREILQNSLDAVAVPGTKVTVEFEAVQIPIADFPHADELARAMRQCLGGGENNSDNRRETAFFKNAIQTMSAPKVLCLKISDFGTTGMRGDYHKQRGQWHAITKARGSSDKRDPTAGGSFGIGKHASFAVSSLRTVFYGTRYKNEGGEIVERAQGKSILMSHNTGDGGDYTSGTGFWGKIDGCRPLEGDGVPAILRHNDSGSVVFIAGFDAGRDWQHKITATVLANFFYAIYDDKLQVLIQDDKGNIIDIDRDTLDERFAEIKQLEIDKEEIDNSYCYYRAITEAPKEGRLDSERPHLGHCKMWIMQKEGLPKRVALLRKTGMLITDEQKGIQRWAGRLDFAGVFLCDSDKGNCLLREMENPKHDAFELDRATSENYGECDKALKDLVRYVRDSVDALTKPEDTEVDAVRELDEMLPDTDQPEPKPGDEGEERDIEGAMIYSPKPLKTPKPQIDDSGEGENGDEGGGGETGGDSEGDTPGDGPGEGEGTGGTGERGFVLRPVEIKNVRVVPDADNKKKTVYFTPITSGRVNVSLSFVDDDGASRAENRISIKDAKMYQGDDGALPLDGRAVVVDVKRGKRVALSVILAEDASDSIAVMAHIKDSKDSNDENSA